MRRFPVAAALAAVVCVCAFALVLLHPVTASANSNNALELVSGSAAAGTVTDFQGVSADGRHAVFTSTKQLSPSDTDNSLDVYDRVGSSLTLVSTGPSGGNGDYPASFASINQDGSRIAFQTEERLVAADTDNSIDLYERSGGTTSLLSTGPGGGNGAFDAYFHGASADGTRIFFGTNESLVSGDQDTFFDVYQRSGGVTTRLSTGPNGGNGAEPAEYAGISADGTHVFIQTKEALLSSDTDSAQDVYDRSSGNTTLISTGPNGGNGDFGAAYAGSSVDGSKVWFSTLEQMVSADTDAGPDLYQRAGGTTDIMSLGTTGGNGGLAADFVAASDDGSHVFFESQERLTSADVDPLVDVYDHSGGVTTLISPGANGNNGAVNAYLVAASSDGTKVLIRTEESLVSGDTDGANDIYMRQGGTSTLMTVGPTGGNATINAFFAGASRDVSHLFFETSESLTSADTDTSTDVYERFNGTTTLLSGGLSGPVQLDARYRGTSPDGSRVFMRTSEPLLGSDGDAASDIYASDAPGQVVIVKDAQPNDPQNFTFTIGGGLSLGLAAPPGQTTFQLDDDSNPTLSNTQTFTNVAPGAGYSVTESATAGWDPSSACDDGSPVTNIDVSAGETVTCTFTNQKQAKIVVAQQAQPGGDPQSFSYTAGGGLSPSSFQLTDSGTQTFSDVPPGNGYSIAGSVPSGWDQTAASCDDGSPVTNIDVSPGETVTCTFTDRKRGKVIAVKDAVPNDPQDFGFTAGGGLSPSSFQLDDDSDPALSNTQTFTDVVPGSGYSVAETVPSGWDQTSATCSDGSPVANIDVAPGETVTCTFTNRHRGTIVVVNDSLPNDPQNFSFTAGGGLSPASFQLDDDSDPALSNTQTFNDVVPGSGYSVAETVPSGWDLTSSTCSDGSSIANINLAAGETVTCTFANRKRGKVVVVADSTPNDPQDFSFTAGGGLSPSSFQLDDDSDPALSNTQTFNDVVPGSGYSVAETVPSGWDLTSSTCSDGSSIANINLAAGETVTCTFANRKRGTLVVVKDAVPDDPQDFSFTAGGGLSPSSFQLDDHVNPTLSNKQTFSNVPVQNGYSISEAAVTGWIQTSQTCDNGSPVNDIDVAPGQTVTCTFTNTKRGSLTIVEDSQPDDAQDFSYTTTGGLTPSSFSLDDDTDSTLSNTQAFTGISPGTYSATQAAVSGWDATATCSDGSPISAINVSAGENVTCTFTNKQHGTIVVAQQVLPSADPQSFSYTAGGGLSPTSFQLTDGNTQTFSSVSAGSGYSVAETVPSGWDLTSAICSDGSPVSAIDLSPGESITCTFTNKKRGSIVVAQQVQPSGDPQSFSYTAGGGLSPTSFQLTDGNTRTFSSLAPDNGYSIAETVPSGWDLASSTCDDGSPVSNIDVGVGETVTCTFTNVKQGKIIVAQLVQPNGDPQSFSYTAGGGLSPTSFQLTDGNTRTFASVPAGSGYSITETVPSGWDLASSTCDDGSPISDIDVAPAETVTCTFSNRKRGNMAVVKDAVPNDSQDFSFTAGGGLSPSSFQLDDDSDPTLSNNRNFSVSAGSGYSISESVPSGWIQNSATCTDGSPVSNVDVSPGETLTCKFVNVHGYARPKAASPFRTPLVVAYDECTSADSAHGAPLAGPSCTPPSQASPNLTVGTPDSNGKVANAVGQARLDVMNGIPGTSENEADVLIRVDMSDVRLRSDLSDYTGELSAEFDIRLTDKLNGGSGAEPGTSNNFPFLVTVPCADTPATTIGASCAVSTSANALIPDSVVETKRTMWQLSKVQVLDGGPDGVAQTLDNSPFAGQGIFIP